MNDKTAKITGTTFRRTSGSLENLKTEISQCTSPSLTIRNIYELQHQNGRVVILEIPAAPRGIPISWGGHFYGRAGESLVPLEWAKLDEIRNQTIPSDWSAAVVVEATINDLDQLALKRAREVFALKYANRFEREDVYSWTDAEFLERTRITRNGRITRSTLLLLGNPTSTAYLSPNPAQLVWKLDGAEQAYERFFPPFFINNVRAISKDSEHPNTAPSTRCTPCNRGFKI